MQQRGKERKERRGKERRGKERRGKERNGREGKGRKGKERRGEENPDNPPRPDITSRFDPLDVISPLTQRASTLNPNHLLVLLLLFSNFTGANPIVAF